MPLLYPISYDSNVFDKFINFIIFYIFIIGNFLLKHGTNLNSLTPADPEEMKYCISCQIDIDHEVDFCSVTIPVY